jgi:hypothetical protein
MTPFNWLLTSLLRLQEEQRSKGRRWYAPKRKTSGQAQGVRISPYIKSKVVTLHLLKFAFPAIATQTGISEDSVKRIIRAFKAQQTTQKIGT